MCQSKHNFDWCCSFVTVKAYRVLWTGMGAQLARDVPFSAICWSTLEPVSFIFHLSYMSRSVVFVPLVSVVILFPFFSSISTAQEKASLSSG